MHTSENKGTYDRSNGVEAIVGKSVENIQIKSVAFLSRNKRRRKLSINNDSASEGNERCKSRTTMGGCNDVLPHVPVRRELRVRDGELCDGPDGGFRSHNNER